MNPFVESLKRLYQANKITINKLNEFLENNKITKGDYDYITVNGGVK